MATRNPFDEKPLPLKPSSKNKPKSSKTTELRCIIHYNTNTSEKKIRPLTEHSFQVIKEKKEIRQKKGKSKETLDDICKNIPDTFYKQLHGTHGWCYKNFTNVSKILKRKCKEEETEQQPTSSRSKRTKKTEEEQASPLFSPEVCVICDKYRIKVKVKIEIPIKCVTTTAEKTMKKSSKRKRDFKMEGQIAGVDMKAREAHYHPSCRKDYTRKEDRHKKKNDEKTKAEQEAHQAAFEHLCKYIDDSIIKRSKVERLSMLRETYLLFMQDQRPEYYNPKYKTYKLKSKLEKKYGQALQFWQPNYRSELVYSSNVPQGQAIETAFEVAASESRRVEEAALVLRRIILDAGKAAPEMPWPPSHEYLLGENIQAPALLQDFLSVMITGKKVAGTREKLILSLAQDVCKAATRGQWIMPKHLLLGMTIRHLTGSAEILTILNRFGHSVSYSCLLELETAMYNSIIDRQGIMPPCAQVEGSKMIHLCWDNFDLLEETPSGAGTTHTAHGIVIQELSSGSLEQSQETEEIRVPRTKKRSTNYTPTRDRAMLHQTES